DKKDEIMQLALEYSFRSDALIATKVAENGFSLHDEKLNLIVAETWDLITLQQVIGRARVSRKNPRKIEVLIPDYSLSELNQIEWMIRSQLKKFEEALSNPDIALQYNPTPNPYVYYSAVHKKPVVNEIGYKTLKKQLAYIASLKAEEAESPHAFLRKVLSLYEKEPVITDEMYINYDQINDFKCRAKAAWDKYKSSQNNEKDLNILKNELKSACNETKILDKELTTNIQISKVNDILKLAGINEAVATECRIFNVIPNSDINDVEKE
ncbi:MAG: hypothetical protein PUB66_01355, partial [Oscillospiraceae bacterium]|nr:hypothetical protein [Oscillospiraceae bacterium]